MTAMPSDAKPEHPRTGTGRLDHAHVLAIAFPIILANVTTPLIGLVDTAVLGQLGEPRYIGAVAIGAMIFNMIYWAFGFLRMGTTGLTAQAQGSGDPHEVLAALGRALLIAIAVGVTVVALQHPIRETAFWLVEGSQAVEDGARTYFDIRIWATPAALANYALLGWFIGRGKAGTALLLQLILNGTNAALDALFVLVLDMAVAGVALGTMIAEVFAVLCGLALAYRVIRQQGDGYRTRTNTGPAGASPRLHGQCRHHAAHALPALRLQLVHGQVGGGRRRASGSQCRTAAVPALRRLLPRWVRVLGGNPGGVRRWGARRRAQFEAAVRLSSIWAVILSASLGLCFWVFGGMAIDFLTINPDVRETARAFLFWSAIAPVAGVAAFQLDGIFIGSTWTRDMRNAMAISMIVYFAAWAILTPLFGNHGLWASLIVFYLVRAVLPGLAGTSRCWRGTFRRFARPGRIRRVWGVETREHLAIHHRMTSGGGRSFEKDMPRKSASISAAAKRTCAFRPPLQFSTR